MKRDKELTERKATVKISLKIVPFGSATYEVTIRKPSSDEKERDLPRYVQPLTTSVETVEVPFEGSNTYLIPKTTAGL
jgi:hypothetical protein